MVRDAKARVGERTQFFSPKHLQEMQEAFSKVRYGYEASLSYTAAPNVKRADAWIARDADIDGVDFAKYAHALWPMSNALARHLSNRLNVTELGLERLF